MKKIMIMSTFLVLLTMQIALAEGGGNPEVSMNPTESMDCHPLKEFQGLCSSSQDILQEN